MERWKRRLRLLVFLSIVGVAIWMFAPQRYRFWHQLEVPVPDLPKIFQIKQLRRQQISPYDNIIRKYAKRYGFDWRLIAAQIRQESSFNPKAISRAGAKGLMQLMPGTAKEVGVSRVYHPRENIAGGVFYLRKMYDRFPKVKTHNRVKFALASYNGGIGRVFDARSIARYDKQNEDEWRSVKKAFPKLSRRYRKVHRKIWGKPQPKYGFFEGFRETVSYVESVMAYYEEYRRMGIHAPNWLNFLREKLG